MSKVPCGGFKLDENFLGMNENDELSLVGGGGEGEAYKSLVTDGDGNVKWEDRLAYDDSKVVVGDGSLSQFVKVADEIPSWASVDTPMKVWLSNGEGATLSAEDYLDLGNGSFMTDYAFFIVADNFEFNGAVFPEKGVYFVSGKSEYTTGIASADSDTPEITWDGNIGEIKKIDEKFLPDILILYVHNNAGGMV